MCATMHRPPHRSAGSCRQRHPLQRSVCTAQHSLERLAPMRPHLRFGTALAHHRTGLVPAHICTGTKSTPHPHQHRDRVDPLPTSALRQSASQHLHRNRIHPSPTSAPPLLPSGTSGHLPLQPHALCCNRAPPVNDPAADGTCGNRLHAAALPCHWLHPIRSKQAKRRRRWPNRVACARHCGRGWAST